MNHYNLMLFNHSDHRSLSCALSSTLFFTAFSWEFPEAHYDQTSPHEANYSHRDFFPSFDQIT